MTQELEEERRDATRYTVHRALKSKTLMYQVNKEICGVSVEHYWVSIKSREVYCDCAGFRIQKYPKIEHKHVKIVQDWKDRGEPEGAQYTIKGTGAAAEIIYLGA